MTHVLQFVLPALLLTAYFGMFAYAAVGSVRRIERDSK